MKRRFGFFLLTMSIVFILIINFIMTPIFNVGEKGRKVLADKNVLYSHVEYLTTGGLERTYKNIDKLGEIADYIYISFESSGCDKIEYQAYDVEGKEYKNVICIFNGEDKQAIIVGAHYDVDGEYHYGEVDPGKLFRGADDNASGIAGILELASMLGSSTDLLPSQTHIVAYTLEEMPYFYTKSMGSEVHAKSLHNQGVQVKYMLVLEMIGYFSDEKIQTYPINILKLLYPRTGDFIALIGKIGSSPSLRQIKTKMSQSSRLDIYSLNAPSMLRDIYRSDHSSYWKYGYEAYMITDTSNLRNPNYHSTNDTIDTLNFEKMSEVVNGVYGILTQ